ncbi:MAG: tRNA pseudouridine(13) synthase TruD [Chromatiaceae bacterium]|jgi:tRNA pseudouridine13 synthase|nr:tRNA pseudouridine(13) synthase TruD [Chromatiaceae bacterium]
MNAADLPCWRSFDDLPYAHGGPVAAGWLRKRPEDFRVDEILSFEPDGEGEHLLVLVRKTGANTEWVARRLAAHAGLPTSSVGYAGLKDRYAVTTQWFSLHTGLQRDSDFSGLDLDGVEVLETSRHRRKLRRGALRGNRFRIRVGGFTSDIETLGERLATIGQLGVPNYYGPQRFGNREGNLPAAHALFTGAVKRIKRHLRGIWLSAARSQLFNEVLAKRITRGDWDRPVPGDRMQLAGSRASFLAEVIDDELRERCLAFDINPSGPLWGAGEMLTAGEAAALELQLAESFPVWTAGLAAAGLRQERRPLRLKVSALESLIGDDALELRFELPAGAYATAVLRELVDWSRKSVSRELD